MTTVNTKIVQSNFSNGMVSPKLKWTTNDEIHLSSAVNLTNAIVGDYGEVIRREGIFGVNTSPVSENVYSFTLQDSVTGDVERLVLTHYADGGMEIYRAEDLLTRSIAPVLTHEDIGNNINYFPETREVTEEREENPDASTTKTASLVDLNTGTYQWTYETEREHIPWTGGYDTLKSSAAAYASGDAIAAGDTLVVLNEMSFIANSKQLGTLKEWSIEFSGSGSWDDAANRYVVTQEDVDAGYTFKVVSKIPKGATQQPYDEIMFTTSGASEPGSGVFYARKVNWTFGTSESEPVYTYEAPVIYWVKVDTDGNETPVTEATFVPLHYAPMTPTSPPVDYPPIQFEFENPYEVNTAQGQFDPTPANITVKGRLRHANWGGEEYFCGKGQPPFKVSLNNGAFSVKLLDYEIPPFNDTVVGSEYKIYFKKVEVDGSGFGIVQLPTEMSVSKHDALKLVNYDAKSSIRYGLSYADYKTLLPNAVEGSDTMKDSEAIPAVGNVTLRAEGSYWAGTIALYERMKLKDGTTQDVELGQITAGGLASTMTLPAKIENLNSLVFFRVVELTNAQDYMKANSPNGSTLPNDEYKDLGVTVSITVSGTQEVLCLPHTDSINSKIRSEYPAARDGYEIIVFKCDTEITNGSFETNTFAIPIQRVSRMDFPRTICFFQDRLVFGGTDANPKRLIMSKTGNPLNFQYGTNDDDALSTVVSGSDLEEIRWLCPREALLVGTSRREYSLRGSSTAAVTPTSIKVSKPSGDSSYTSANIECHNVENGVACVRGGSLEILFYQYSSDTYSYVPSVMNALNKELFEQEGGIKDFVVCTRPETELWVLMHSGRVMHVRVSGEIKNGWTLLEFPGMGYKDKSGNKYTSFVSGLFVVHEEDKDIIGFVVKREEGKYCSVGFFYSDVMAYAQKDKDVAASVELFKAGLSRYRDYMGSVSDFETVIVLNPFRLSEQDSLGKRVVSIKSALCLCEARIFESSSDGGETWIEENKAYESDGSRRELVLEEYELRSPGRWSDRAMLMFRTKDNHSFVLSCVRTRLTVGGV